MQSFHYGMHKSPSFIWNNFGALIKGQTMFDSFNREKFSLIMISLFITSFQGWIFCKYLDFLYLFSDFSASTIFSCYIKNIHPCLSLFLIQWHF